MFTRKPLDQTAQPVSMQDGQDALEALRGRRRVDVDAYLARLDAHSMLETPLGPTPDCLTLKTLEQYGFDSVTRLPHLSTCDSCTNALRAYRAVKERSLEPARPLLGIEVMGMIDLAPARAHFDLKLHMDSVLDMQPGNLTVANAAFSKIYVSAIEEMDSDAETGWTYRAVCVAEPNTELRSTCSPGVEFVDWIKVSGTSRAGQTFVASDLARFAVGRAEPVGKFVK